VSNSLDRATVARALPGTRAGARKGRAVAVAVPTAFGEGATLMFERFTDRARRVVVLAQEEARMLNHNYIGTEGE